MLQGLWERSGVCFLGYQSVLSR